MEKKNGLLAYMRYDIKYLILYYKILHYLFSETLCVSKSSTFHSLKKLSLKRSIRIGQAQGLKLVV